MPSCVMVCGRPGGGAAASKTIVVLVVLPLCERRREKVEEGQPGARECGAGTGSAEDAGRVEQVVAIDQQSHAGL